MNQSLNSTLAEHQPQATNQAPLSCAFELQVYSKYDDAATEASGPTLSIAISHALPDLRHLAHSRAVFGARRQPEHGRSYGSWQIDWPDEDDRPSTGYEQFA